MKETIDRKSLKDYKRSRHGNFLKKFGNHCIRVFFNKLGYSLIVFSFKERS